MPVITGSIAAPVEISGNPGVVSSVITGEPATAVQVYGLPGVVRTAGDIPSPTQPPAPDAVRARVLDAAGVFIAHLPDAQGLRWLDEHNTAGSGSIDYRRYDDVEDEHPNLWAPCNQIPISVGNVDVFRLILDSEGGYRIDPATGDRIDSWAGMGQLGVLNSGMCIPEYGWRPEATNQRTFDYGSNPAIGGWYVPSEWRTPVGKLLRKSWRWTYRKRHQPKGFKDKRAQWLWWRNPDAKNTANETCYLVSSFTLSQARRVRHQVAGDDTLEYQVDGEVRATAGPGGWKKPKTLVMWMSAGTHYVAAKVTNTPGSSGNQNRSGFIASIASINGDGDVVKILRRTTPGTWKIRRQLGAAPGWLAGQILRQLVAEQQTRGCAGHGPVTFGFTTARDSAGVAWTGRQEISIPVGTLALDYIEQLVETGIDVAMTPGMRLNAWRRRGADRSGWIRLDQGKDAGAVDETGTQLPPIRNVAYARATTGWVGRSNTASVAARGRRETMITLGSSRSSAQTSAAIGAMLPDLAEPPQTVEVTISGAAGGPQPYKDFFVADWVSYRPAGATGRRRFRVMSIAGEVAPEGHPNWTIRLYED